MNLFRITILMVCAHFCFLTCVDAQTIKAINAWKSTDYKKVVNVEDDLLLYMELDQTLMMAAMERELEASGNLYGVMKISMGGSEQIAGPLLFMPSTTMTAQSIPFMMNVKLSEFKEELTSRSSEMDMGDLGMMMSMAAPRSTQKSWISLLAGNATVAGEKDIKVAFYLVSDDKSIAPIGKPLATGNFKLNVTDDGIKNLYSSGRIPERYKPTKDNGVTSDFHKKNLNNIVWTNTEANISTTDAGITSCNSLVAGLYGKAFLPKSLKNYGVIIGEPNNCKYSLVFYIDGKKEGETGSIKVEKEACDMSTILNFCLAPSPKGQESPKIVDGFAQMIKSLSIGNYKLRVDVVMDYLSDLGNNQYETFTLASSEIDLNLNKSDKEAWEKIYAPEVKLVASTSSAKRVSFKMENTSSANVDFEFMGGGVSWHGTINANDSKNFNNMPVGYFVKINGKEFYKTVKADAGKTITIR